ncbi:MAG: HAMP domain-containing histidine kinase [Clostridiales bacterium]|nr:HAMP domain-containing histidine kinase [Clostridiales bacterium]
MARKNREKKHKTTLSTRLVRFITLILFCVMLAIIFATYRGLDFIYMVSSAITSFYAAREVEDLYDNPGEDFALLMDDIEREFEMSAEVYTEDGSFVYSSSYKGELSAPPYDSSVIIIPDSIKKNYEEVTNLGEVSNNSFNISRDTSSSQNSEYLVLTWIMENGYTLKLFKLNSTVEVNAQIAFGFISGVTVIIVLIAVALMNVFIGRTVKPIKDMSRITNNMAQLDFSEKCEPNNIKELSVLSSSINEMSDALENALVDLREKNKKLQDDIEQERTIDQLRQVFISGVSHELKTPIAIIQGYAEGLKVFLETDPETADKYCDTIISETERMNSLVMKLLDIMKYESGEYKQLYTEINLKSVIDDWFDRNRANLNENGITTVNDIDESITGFGDSFLVSTVVNNYLSNAVFHVCSEMVIKAWVKEIENNTYCVSIFNSGNPIEAKDIDKIWDSFYRADKAMSRAQGRFGLGLAIVASIQKLQGQAYGVINHEDGVEFWFNVKKYEDD